MSTAMSPWRRRSRHLRRLVSAVFATIVISLAVLVGISQLVLPWLTRNPARVETWLSQMLGRSVRIGHIDSDWVGAGPRLVLDDVRIAPTGKSAAFEVPHAQLRFDLLAAFRSNRTWNELGVSNLDLSVNRQDDGRWQVRGLVLDDTGTPSMGSLGALVLKQVAVTVNDPSRNLHMRFRVPELRLLNLGAHAVRLLGHVKPSESDAEPLDLVAEYDLETRTGEMYIGGRDLDLARLSASQPLMGISLLAGRGVAQVWASLDHGRITEFKSRLDLANATFASASPVSVAEGLDITPRTHFDRLALVGRWQASAQDWRVDVAGLTTADAATGSSDDGQISVTCTNRKPVRCRAGAKNLDIAPLANLAMLSDELPVGLRSWLYKSAPTAMLATVEFDWHSSSDFSADADIADVRIASAGPVPGIELAKAHVSGDAAALLLELPQQATRIDYPHMFRKPFAFSHLGGDVVAWRNGPGWQIASDRIGFNGEGYGGELRGGIDLQGDGTRPALDLSAALTHAEVPAAKLFWPVNIMPPPVVEWLDRALVSGHLIDGRVVVHGDLDNWPFHDNSGRFEASCTLDDMTLDYHPDWPRAEHVHATADFVGVGLEAEADTATVKGVRASNVRAQVDDLGKPVLDLSAQGNGSAARLFGFLRATPIGTQHATALNALALGGKGKVDVSVHLPISDEVSDTLIVDGDVNLSNVTLEIAAQDFHLSGITGNGKFNQSGFATDTLTSTWDQRPADLTMAVGGYVTDSRHALEARLDTTGTVAAMFKDVNQIQPLLEKLPGEAHWRLGLDIDDEAAVASARKHLWLESDLKGVAIHLPAPLAKTPDTAVPFRLDLELPYAGAPFSAHLGRRIAVNGRLPAGGKPLAARVMFGVDKADAPVGSGLHVGGHASIVDAGEWLALVGGSEAGGGDQLRDLDVRVDDLRFGKYAMGDTRIGLTTRTDAIEVTVDGAALAGSVVIPAANAANKAITADFKRLYVPDVPDEMNVPDSTESSTIAPTALPALHLAVADFRLGSAHFGSARFDSTPTPQGMRIDTLAAKSANIDIAATGTWTGTAEDNQSRFAIDIKSHNLGKMMDALGFAGLIDGGVTQANFNATWPGPPTAFALPKLDGILDVKVDEGRILDVDPGAGRIFGLLSLREIPRRLSLDFTDIFRSGLSFNGITGHFRFEDGNAWTDDLLIKSPSADIFITGRTGLRDKDYDQIMSVTPHAGMTLPLVGAVAGGPIGAAAGLVMQGLLGKQIGRATRSRYHVGGSWEKPEIESIGKEKSGPKK